jgi:hypothetical protein
MMRRISVAEAEIQVIENNGVTLTELRDRTLTQKDVKNEGCSSEFIENKGAKKVILRVY